MLPNLFIYLYSFCSLASEMEQFPLEIIKQLSVAHVVQEKTN